MLRQLVATCDRTARGRRDRALLLFGFAGALRRSELVALQVEDVKGDAGRFVQNCTLAAQPGNKGRKDSLTPAWARATSNRLPLKLVLQQGFERQIPLVQRQGQTLPHTLVCERAICGRQMA
jgi:integrase